MNRQAEKVFQQTSSPKVREDIEEFNKRWKITFQKIGKAYSDELVLGDGMSLRYARLKSESTKLT